MAGYGLSPLLFKHFSFSYVSQSYTLSADHRSRPEFRQIYFVAPCLRTDKEGIPTGIGGTAGRYKNCRTFVDCLQIRATSVASSSNVEDLDASVNRGTLQGELRGLSNLQC